MDASRFLFVYGTLLPWATSDMGATQRAKLARECHIIGDASTSGLLFDLGGYPGLIEGPSRVAGALYEFRREPKHTLSWLDVYEGISGRPSDEYHRFIKDVELRDGCTLQAYVYVICGDANRFRRISNGVWPANGRAS